MNEELIAKTVVKNKMWIVEAYTGTKVGNIMAVEEGGFVYVHDDQREQFASIKLLSKKYNIVFAKAEKVKREKQDVYEVYGFPTNSQPQNEVLDVQRYLPIYTKGAKSKSFFCAGYYIIKFSSTWVRAYCPKLITLNRYEYEGPFKSQERMIEAMKERNGQ
jgi:Ethanolamine utilization protein EutJ (predicted chaperonin)